MWAVVQPVQSQRHWAGGKSHSFHIRKYMSSWAGWMTADSRSSVALLWKSKKLFWLVQLHFFPLCITDNTQSSWNKFHMMSSLYCISMRHISGLAYCCQGSFSVSLLWCWRWLSKYQTMCHTFEFQLMTLPHFHKHTKCFAGTSTDQ